MTSFERTIVGLTAAFSLTILTVSGVVVTTAHAQGQDGTAKPGRQGRGEGRGERQNSGTIHQALKATNLTPEQETKVKDVLKKLRDETEALSADPATRREKSLELVKKAIADVEAVLTPEQKTKFQEELKKAQTEGRSPMAMFNRLNLTPEQKAKVEPIIKDTMTEMAKIREDDSLDRSAKGQKAMELTEAMRAKIRPLLTADQQKKFDEMKLRSGRGVQGGGRRAERGEGNSRI